MQLLTALRSAAYLLFLTVTVIPYAFAVIGWSWLPPIFVKSVGPNQATTACTRLEASHEAL